MTIKIEFPSDRKDVAAAFGKALVELAGSAQVADKVAESAPVADGPKPGAGGADGSVSVAESHTATPPGESVTAQTTGPSGANAAGYPTHDELNGVPFNKDYCSKTADPDAAFMKSGKFPGRWKKKSGISQESFDAWYNAEVAKPQRGGAAAGANTLTEAEKVATVSGSAAGAAFGTATAQPADGNVWDTFGTLMKWISEQQNAENMTTQDANQAYTACSATIPLLAKPDSVDLRRAVFEYLKATKGL